MGSCSIKKKQKTKHNHTPPKHYFFSSKLIWRFNWSILWLSAQIQIQFPIPVSCLASLLCAARSWAHRHVTSLLSKDAREMPVDSEYALPKKQLMDKKQASHSEQLYRKSGPVTLPDGAQAFQASPRGVQLSMQVTEAALTKQLCSYYTSCSGDKVPPSGSVLLKAHAMKAAGPMICPLTYAWL